MNNNSATKLSPVLGVLLACLFQSLSSTAMSQRSTFQDDILSIPAISANGRNYVAELELIADSEPLQFELLNANEIPASEIPVTNNFADDLLFVDDVFVDGISYWLELALQSPTVFQLQDSGINTQHVSSQQLDIDTQPFWQKMDGDANDIGIGADGSVWVIGLDERSGGFGIYFWQDEGWNRVHGGAVRIDVGPDGIPWIVNNSHNIYRLVGDEWQRMPGNARDIGIGADGSVWVVSGGGTYRWNWDIYYWDRLGVSGVRVDVGPDGLPWVIDQSDDIHQLVAEGYWIEQSGDARDIGIGADGSVWIVGTRHDGGGHDIFRWSGIDWIQVQGSGRQISGGADGFPWVLSSEDDIYRGY